MGWLAKPPPGQVESALEEPGPEEQQAQREGLEGEQARQALGEQPGQQALEERLGLGWVVVAAGRPSSEKEVVTRPQLACPYLRRGSDAL